MRSEAVCTLRFAGAFCTSVTGQDLHPQPLKVGGLTLPGLTCFLQGWENLLESQALLFRTLKGWLLELSLHCPVGTAGGNQAGGAEGLG